MWTHRLSGHASRRGDNDHRCPYERDRTRVIHCPSFRRLQSKTQILGSSKGDFHRTRLTHSLEVASIGMSIVRNLQSKLAENGKSSLLANDDLIQVICLLHDIGHPPFGHGGEAALNYRMRHHGGFESNAQTLRLLTKVEDSYGEYGLDLTRRSLLGLLKYPVVRSKVVAPVLPELDENKPIRINDWLPPKAYYECEIKEVAWLLNCFSSDDIELFQSLESPPDNKSHGQSRFYSFDCSIMDTADDIAYGVHDLEDAIYLQLIRREALDSPLFRQLLSHAGFSDVSNLIDNLFSPKLPECKRAIGEIVNYFISSIDLYVQDEKFENHLLKYTVGLSEEARLLLKYLMDSVYEHVINSQFARISEYSGQIVVSHLFEAILSNPIHLLDKKSRDLYQRARDESEVYRIISDYIANMTDASAYRLHERLFGMNSKGLFERFDS